MGYDTKQSRLVCEYLKANSEKHFSAEDVYFALSAEGGKIGRTTVYRQLDRLVLEGKVRKFSAGDNEPNCYQFADCDHCHNHYHLKCSGCGKLIHTECDFLDKLSAHIFDDHKFKIDNSKIILYGICELCSKENI